MWTKMIFQLTIAHKRTPGWTLPSSKHGFMKTLCQDAEKRKHQRVILLPDNTHSHPNVESVRSSNGEISCLYLLRNPTSLIQPMEQGVLETIKRRYKHDLLLHLLNEGNERLNIVEFTKTTGPAQQGGPGGPWPTQLSGQPWAGWAMAHPTLRPGFFSCRSIATSSIKSAQSIDTRTRTHVRVLASFPGAWERG